MSLWVKSAVLILDPPLPVYQQADVFGFRRRVSIPGPYGLLVHGLNIFRQPSSDDCALVTDTFAGIAPSGLTRIIIARLAGMAAAAIVQQWL
jgi:hypothetical protein